MSREIVDDDDGGYTTDDIDPVVDTNLPGAASQSDARRRIEELMERRRLKSLLDDPYREDVDEEL